MRAIAATKEYAATFENDRRIHPRIWDSDYCLLLGLRKLVSKTVAGFAIPHMRIIDFGCGAKPYRPLFPEDCEYIGIDAFPTQYADLVVEPGTSVPLPSSSADFVLSTQVVHIIAEYNGYLMECRRLLRPGGRMLMTTHGTWTHHPASGGDYYRFTQDGLRHIMAKAGFTIEAMKPIVGTLGAGLHLRQLIYNAWLRHLPLGHLAAKILNVLINYRILFEDALAPEGTKMSSPVIFGVIARPSIP